jgi:steroid delta-isomerase-like uncharacterized protein
MNDLTPALIDRRLAIVNEHIAGEDACDAARVVKTFHTPHYWMRPLGSETAGAAAVAQLLDAVFAAFPDLHFAPMHTYHAADALIMEGRITGTHRGVWAGVPASGKPIEMVICCIFHFEADRLMSESVYFDHATLLAQIGAR